MYVVATSVSILHAIISCRRQAYMTFLLAFFPEENQMLQLQMSHLIIDSEGKRDGKDEKGQF